MAQVIRLKRHIGAPSTPVPGTGATQLSVGELAYNRESAAHATNPGPDNLYISDGVGVHPLVSQARQLELAGSNQTVAAGPGNTKTFAVDAATPANSNLSITGGASGGLLSTNGLGQLTWTTAPPAVVNVSDPIVGNGAATGTLPATGPLGLLVASHALATDQVQVGADDVRPVTSAGLRTQLGAAATALALGTTATTVVPAIYELSQRISALVGAVIVVGQYNANNNTVTGVRPPASAPPYSIADGSVLVPTSAANRGWLFLVQTAGTPAAGGEAPNVAMAVGDWLVSSGAGQWVHLSMGLSSIAAVNVSSDPPAAPHNSWTNVQLFLNGLYSTSLRAVVPDGVSIVGDGISAAAGSALAVALVDGGSYA